MANNRVLSQLMLDAYKPEGQRVGFGEAGFKTFGEGQDLPNGLRIQAYVNESTKEVVVGVAGTNGFSDAGPDVDFVTGGYHDQFREAVKYAHEVQGDIAKQYPNQAQKFTYSTTGHSLGGGIGQVLSHTFGWNGTTFDAPAASAVIEDAGYRAHLQELGIIPKGPGNLVNYTESGSIVSSVPGRSYIGDQVSLDLTSGTQSVVGAALLSNPVTVVLGAGLIIHDQWGPDGQHNADKFTTYFSNPHNPGEIDGWHYVGGTYEGWYSENNLGQE